MSDHGAQIARAVAHALARGARTAGVSACLRTLRPPWRRLAARRPEQPGVFVERLHTGSIPIDVRAVAVEVGGVAHYLLYHQGTPLNVSEPLSHLPSHRDAAAPARRPASATRTHRR